MCYSKKTQIFKPNITTSNYSIFPAFPMKIQIERRFQNLRILKIAKIHIDLYAGNPGSILLYIQYSTVSFSDVDVGGPTSICCGTYGEPPPQG